MVVVEELDVSLRFPEYLAPTLIMPKIPDTSDDTWREGVGDLSSPAAAVAVLNKMQSISKPSTPTYNTYLPTVCQLGPRCLNCSSRRCYRRTLCYLKRNGARLHACGRSLDDSSSRRGSEGIERRGTEWHTSSEGMKSKYIVGPS